MQACLLRRAAFVYIAHIDKIVPPPHGSADAAITAGGLKLVVFDVAFRNIVGIWIKVVEHCIYPCLGELARLYRIYVICIELFEKCGIDVQIFGHLEIRAAFPALDEEAGGGNNSRSCNKLPVPFESLNDA